MYSSILTCVTVAAALWLPFSAASLHPKHDDGDLEIFVSRPDLRPPKFTVSHVDESLLAPGYWFTGPYVDLINRKPTRIYETYQIGPHIYDNFGQLVWSGAGLFPARNVFDFKLSSHGSPTFLLGPHEKEQEHIGGAGVIMNSTFEIRKFVHLPRGARTVNMHEFNVLDNGDTALMFMHEVRLFESEEPNFHGWIIDLGFVEVDIATGKSIFEWWAADYVHPLESTVERPRGAGDPGHAWDFFHINAVDKDENGDYLVSARHMNTIFKISGLDGSILWRLGGKHSSFQQQGFNFSSQHDSRFRMQNETTTVISFLNNAADGTTHTADVSSAMVVALDHSVTPMTARLLHKYDRPDGRRTNLRGNVQTLPNSNVFISWSANSYMSEHTQDGRLVLEAHFQSDRFATYRSYKFDFVGHPTLPPDLVCSAYGVSEEQATTVCHTSWNGATEVRSWNFHEAHPDGTSARLLATVKKEGFESMLMSEGYSSMVFVEALDLNGNILGQSEVVNSKIPGGAPFDGKTHDIPGPKLHSKPKPDTKQYNPKAQSDNLEEQANEILHEKIHETKEKIHSYNKVFGDGFDKLPSLWPMIFCVMLGAIGALMIVHSSRAIRAFMVRRGEKQGYLRVGEA